MRTQHDDFVALVRARYLSDDVERTQLVRVERVANLDFHLHRDPLLHRAEDPAVMLGCQHQLWNRTRCSCITASAISNKDVATMAVAAAGTQDRAYTLIEKALGEIDRRGGWCRCRTATPAPALAT